MSSLIDLITPVIITFNEAPNLERVLDRLQWARRVVIVDSHSEDDTVQIARSFSNVEVFENTFVSFADQCAYGVSLIDTDWVLSLDSDYVCGRELPGELNALEPAASDGGYAARFRYCIGGRPLRSTLYPDRVVLHRRDATYEQDGHAHRVVVSGNVGRLSTLIDHDDRKPLSVWLDTQDRYSGLEVEKLRSTPGGQLSRTDRLRLGGVVMPLVMPIYCLLWKRLMFDGRAGWVYTLQRTYAELLLALRLLDARTRGVD